MAIETKLFQDSNDYYRKSMAEFGVTPKGLNWKDDQAQQVRFEQLAMILPTSEPFSINDIGCGFGDFFDFLINGKFLVSSYRGYDISAELIKVAKNRCQFHTSRGFYHIDQEQQIVEGDYSVASGIFNLKFNNTEEDWLHYILKNMDNMFHKSKKGMACNFLTSYSDEEHKRADLYYADPCFIFDYCKRNLSNNIALLHDYYQYDFTILVRK